MLHMYRRSLSAISLLFLTGATLRAQTTTTTSPTPPPTTPPASGAAVAALPTPTTLSVEEERVARILTLQKDLEDRNRTFRFGLSIGYRNLLANGASIYRDAVLNPITRVVEVDTIDQGDVVLSGVVVAFPWERPVKSAAPNAKSIPWWRLGFIANVDLASFSNDEVTTFNRSIEGGGGVAVKLSNDFSLALTFERVFSRRLRSYIKPGQVLPVAAGEEPPATLDRNNNSYFRNDNLSAMSFKFVYFLR